MKKNYLLYFPSRELTLVAIFVLGFVAFRPEVQAFDPMGYYSWLRSVVIEGDGRNQ